MDCPSELVKRWLLAEELAGSALEAVVAHVQECAACQDDLERLTVGKELISVRSAAPGDAAASSEAEDQLLAAIKGRAFSVLEQAVRADGDQGRDQRSADAWDERDAPPTNGERVLDEGGPTPSIPGYVILRELGRGGMGTVYLARDERLQREVAIKVADTRWLPDATRFERFRAEALAMARLKHPHIIEIYDVGEADGLAFIALEYAAGGALNELIGRESLSWRRAGQIVESLARAVHFAHQQGLVHRDLKPANVLFSADGVAKISDFGLVKQLEDDPGWTRTGDVIGTPSYMAPEQVRGRPAEIGPHTDVYALGVILYELLTGQTPFSAATPLEVMNQVVEQEPPSPSSAARSTPPDLASICLQCLHKAPARRYATAQDLADDLRRFLAGETVAARRAGLIERSWRWSRRRPSLAALIAVVMLLATVGFPGATWLWLDAERAKDLAEQSDAAQRWASYRANIAAAGSFLQLNNTSAARRALDATPEEHRKWEWDHFNSRLRGTKLVMREHDGAVRNIAVSPDGRRLASTSVDGFVRIWNPESGDLLATLPGQEKAKRQTQVEFSPDGRLLLAAGPDESVHLWDMQSFKLHATLPGHVPGVQACRFSPDGSRIATVFAGTPLCRIWNAETMQLVSQIEFDSKVDGAVFSPVSNDVAFYLANGTISVWDANRGEEVARWHGHDGSIKAADFSPDGQLFATGGNYGDNCIRLWDAKNGQLVRELAGHDNAVYAIDFSEDGLRLASGTASSTIGLWDVATGTALSIDDASHRGPVYRVAFSPDGSLLASASRDQTVRLWDPHDGRQIALMHGHSDAVHEVAFDPVGKTLYSGSVDGTIAAWDVEARKKTGVLRGHAETLGDVAFSPDGTRCTSASWDGTVRIWDVDAEKELLRLPTDAPIATGVAYHPTGDRLVAVDRRSLSVWDAESGELLVRERLPKASWPDRRVAISPDGRWLVTGTFAGELIWWNAETWRPLTKTPAHDGPCRDAAFRPDSRRLVTVGNDHLAHVWNPETRARVATLRGHRRQVTSVVFDHAGGLIATGSEDGTVRLWDAGDYRELAILEHGSYVYDVAFSPDGERLAVGCDNHSIRLWDVASGHEVGQLLDHEAFVWALTFSPDGKKLLSGSGDNTLRIWNTR